MSRAEPRSRRRRFLAVGALLLAGCSFDYSDGEVGETGEEAIPQVELLDVTMVIVRNNRLELTARRIASFPEEGYQEFAGLAFREFGPEGDLRLEGEAESGILDLESEDVELMGTVRFYSTVEEASIESEFLSWDADARVLTAPADRPVVLTRDDGSRVEGRGMTVDGRRNSVEFSAGVEGVFVDPEEAR